VLTITLSSGSRTIQTGLLTLDLDIPTERSPLRVKFTK
jgi:hypothetical protein